MKKIAIPVSNNSINEHFGQCDSYEIYEISDDNNILNVEKISSSKGCGCKSNIAEILSDKGVSIMLAGGIGEGAIQVLNNEGIQVVRGCSGKTEDIVKNFIEGRIIDNGLSCKQHKHHHPH